MQYCQKALREIRKIQFQSNFDTITVTLLDMNLAPVTTFPAVQVFDATTTLGYYFYEVEIDLSAPLPAGFYKIEIEVDDGAGTVQTALTEWIETADAWSNVNKIGFSNTENDYGLYFGDEFVAELIVESLAYRKKPTSTRSFFRDSAGLPSVLSAKFQRKVGINFYNLPPYLYEQLEVGFMCSTVDIENQQYVSEEGMEEPEYKAQHVLLSNNSITLESKTGLNPGGQFSNFTNYIVTEVDDEIVDNFGDNLVWKK